MVYNSQDNPLDKYVLKDVRTNETAVWKFSIYKYMYLQ